jgi:hypothetical protein
LDVGAATGAGGVVDVGAACGACRVVGVVWGAAEVMCVVRRARPKLVKQAMKVP